MAYNEALTGRIRKALEAVPTLEEKKMFRGVAFMVDGKMCITAGDNKIMCRIDPLLHDEAVKKKGCSTVIMRGREYKGWVYITEEGIQLKKDFAYWIKLALDFNKKAKASPKKKKNK